MKHLLLVRVITFIDSDDRKENELVFKIFAIDCSGTIIIINYNFHHVYVRTGPDFTSSFSKIGPFKKDLGRL